MTAQASNLPDAFYYTLPEGAPPAQSLRARAPRTDSPKAEKQDHLGADCWGPRLTWRFTWNTHLYNFKKRLPSFKTNPALRWGWGRSNFSFSTSPVSPVCVTWLCPLHQLVEFFSQFVRHRKKCLGEFEFSSYIKENKSADNVYCLQKRKRVDTSLM